MDIQSERILVSAMLHLPHELIPCSPTNLLCTCMLTMCYFVRKKTVHYCTKMCLVKVLSKLISDSTVEPENEAALLKFTEVNCTT